MKRLIDAENLKKEIKSAFYGNIGLTVTSAVNEVIDRQPTIYPENLRPVGWWRYNKKTRSWHCGRCGWKNPLMSPDGPSPDGEPFPCCMCCGAKMAGDCYEIEKNHLKSIGSDIHK